MRALLDTNVLLRHANRADAGQKTVSGALDRLLAQNVDLCLCNQNVVEFWAVSTRPVGANGLGKEPRLLRPDIDVLCASFSVVPDPPGVLTIWLDLCTTHEVRGRQAFDARLVAVMVGSGITRLVTLNPADFGRYPGLELIVPGAGT